MDSHRSPTRREFLKTAGAASAAVAVPYIITSSALGKDDRPPASDRIVMAGIGIGNMGRGDQEERDHPRRPTREGDGAAARGVRLDQAEPLQHGPDVALTHTTVVG